MSVMLIGASRILPPAVHDLCNMTEGMWASDGIPNFKQNYECEAFSKTPDKNNKSDLKFTISAPARLGNTSLPNIHPTYQKKAHSDCHEHMRSIQANVLAVWRHMEKNREGNCLKAGAMKEFLVGSNSSNSNSNRSSTYVELKTVLEVPEIAAPSKVETKQSVANKRKPYKKVCFVQNEGRWSSDTSS